MPRLDSVSGTPRFSRGVLSAGLPSGGLVYLRQQLPGTSPRRRDMVSLSDDEMQAVMELAAPVCPYDRGRFLRSVADELT